MGFTLGQKSIVSLVQVHPALVKVVTLAAELSPIVFCAYEGVRSKEKQKVLFYNGASTTLESKHLIQPDGFGHAVDLVPWVDYDFDGTSELRWDWPLCFKIAEAVQEAAIIVSVGIRWGGCWDKRLNNVGDPEHASMDYAKRRREENRRAFLDGPHFELLKTTK